MEITPGNYEIELNASIYKTTETPLGPRQKKASMFFQNGKEITVIFEENRIIGMETDMKIIVDLENQKIKFE